MEWAILNTCTHIHLHNDGMGHINYKAICTLTQQKASGITVNYIPSMTNKFTKYLYLDSIIIQYVVIVDECMC